MRADLMLMLCRGDGVKKSSRARSGQKSSRARSRQRDMRAEASGCATAEEFRHATAAKQSHIVEMLRPTQQDQCAFNTYITLQTTYVPQTAHIHNAEPRGT